ncbi:MAG: response regulator transcription factor [Lachnospiraceae bacterium]|nr:response regulator transcription factor [Lachnospiraceae bacterium]
MRIGICEDEQLFLEFEVKIVQDFFTAHNEVVEIHTFSDGTELLESYGGKDCYDLILLDLQMTHSDGMEIAGAIRQLDRTVPIIFVTGVEHRALEGYHVEALDYVVKSDIDNRLPTSLLRFLDKRRESSIALETTNGETIILPYERILSLESEKRGVKITALTETYYSAQPISKVAALLPQQHFMEIYKSVFVQLRAIKRIGSDYVEMADGSTLPLSRRKKKRVMSGVLELVKGRI